MPDSFNPYIKDINQLQENIQQDGISTESALEVLEILKKLSQKIATIDSENNKRRKNSVSC